MKHRICNNSMTLSVIWKYDLNGIKAVYIMQKYDPDSFNSERAENGIPSISTKASVIFMTRDDCVMQIFNFLSE